MVSFSFFIFCTITYTIWNFLFLPSIVQYIYIIGEKTKNKINKNKAKYPCAHYCEKKMFYSIILVGRIASVLPSTFICIFYFPNGSVNCRHDALKWSCVKSALKKVGMMIHVQLAKSFVFHLRTNRKSLVVFYAGASHIYTCIAERHVY